MSRAKAPSLVPRPSLARNHDFAKLWAGETVSLIGTEVTVLALPLVAVISLHASAAEVGVLNAFRFAPFLGASLFAGVFVDRARRRLTMLTANCARSLLIGAIPVIAATGSLRMQHLYGIAFGIGLFTVFFDLAYQSYLPSIVDRSLLPAANTRLQASASAAELGGPGVGGLLVQAVGAPYALVVDAVSYVVSAASLLAIRHREPRAETVERQPMLPAIREGFGFTFRNRYLRAIAGEAATFNLFDQAIMTVFVVYAIRDLGLSPGLLGLVISSGAAGALVGSVVTNRIEARWGFGPTLVGSMVIACTVPLLLALPHGSRVITTGALGAIFFGWGAAVAVSNVLVVTLRQTVTPDRMLGRMNASYRFFTFGAIPVGGLLGGGLAATTGLRAALLTSACGLVFAVLWVLLSPVGRLSTSADVSQGGELYELSSDDR